MNALKEHLNDQALSAIIIGAIQLHIEVSNSFCGIIYKPGCSKVYECKNCNKCIDRDINASKNILMKGILSL